MNMRPKFDEAVKSQNIPSVVTPRHHFVSANDGLGTFYEAIKFTCSGFTLVEVLVAMAIGAVVMTSVMTSFYSQHKTYQVQDELLSMQQNLRSAMDLMSRDIRMAGFDPSGSAGAGIVDASDDEIEFTMDLDENDSVDGTNGSDNDEWVLYTLDTDDSIGRQTKSSGSWGALQPVAENFDGLEFYYILENGTMALNPSSVDDIRGVQISLLARTKNADSTYSDGESYEAGSGTVWGPFNDGFRRQLMIRTVICRNLGLDS